jgi:hypothetical protein
MAIPDIQTVSSQRRSLRGKPVEQSFPLLADLGNYFWRTLSSAVEDDYILEIEPLLNDLYLQVSDEGDSPDLEEALLQASSMAAQLCRTIHRDRSGQYDDRFFKTVKRLGKVLILISNSYGTIDVR